MAEHLALETRLARLERRLEHEGATLPRAMAAVLLGASLLGSLALVLGEVAIFSPALRRASLVALGANSASLLVAQGVVYSALLYMLLAAFYTLNRVKFEPLYGVHLPRGTDLGSLLFYVGQAGRLSFPLALKALQMAGLRRTALAQIAGAQEPDWIGLVFPALLLLAALLSILGWWETLTSNCQLFFQFEDDSEDDRPKDDSLLEIQETDVL